jgi:hypothetical protein
LQFVFRLLNRFFLKFEDTKGGNKKPYIEEGHTIQWPKEGHTIQWPKEGHTIQWPKRKRTKGQTKIYKTLHIKESFHLIFFFGRYQLLVEN